MCADCKGALAQRCDAVMRLMESVKEPYSVARGLRLAFPVQPAPNDMTMIALRFGGGR